MRVFIKMKITMWQSSKLYSTFLCCCLRERSSLGLCHLACAAGRCWWRPTLLSWWPIHSRPCAWSERRPTWGPKCWASPLGLGTVPGSWPDHSRPDITAASTKYQCNGFLSNQKEGMDSRILIVVFKPGSAPVRNPYGKTKFPSVDFIVGNSYLTS